LSVALSGRREVRRSTEFHGGPRRSTEQFHGGPRSSENSVGCAGGSASMARKYQAAVEQALERLGPSTLEVLAREVLGLKHTEPKPRDAFRKGLNAGVKPDNAEDTPWLSAFNVAGAAGRPRYLYYLPHQADQLESRRFSNAAAGASCACNRHRSIQPSCRLCRSRHANATLCLMLFSRRSTMPQAPAPLPPRCRRLRWPRPRSRRLRGAAASLRLRRRRWAAHWRSRAVLPARR
jgi:hypothetical protein